MKKNYLTASLVVLAITVLIKIVAFAKQMVIGSYLGADGATDVFFLAQELVVSVVFAAFAAVAVSFIPRYQARQIDGEGRENGFFTSTLLLFGCIAIVLTVLLYCFSDQVAPLLLGGNQGLSVREMALALRVMSLVVFFGYLNTLFGAVLEAHLIFMPSKAFGLVLSVVTIPAVIFFSKSTNADCLFYATVVAYGTQSLILVVATFLKTKVRPSRPAGMTDLKILVAATVPVAIGNGVYQLGNLIDKVIGANVGDGVPSALAYAQTITDSVCALTITAVVSVLFAFGSRLVAMRAWSQLGRLIETNVVILLSACLPLGVVLFFSSESIVSLVYGRGSFGHEAVENTSWALRGLACGIPFLVFREIFSRVHYAFGDTRVPLINGLAAMVVHVPASFVLSRFIGVLGIGLGSALSYAFCGTAMVVSARKYIVYSIGDNKKFFARIGAASIVASCLVGGINVAWGPGLAPLMVGLLLTGAVFSLFLYSDVREAMRQQRKISGNEMSL